MSYEFLHLIEGVLENVPGQIMKFLRDSKQ